MAAGGHELQLMGMWASPFVTRAKLALHLKGLSYDYLKEDLGSKSELLLRSNPVHKAVSPGTLGDEVSNSLLGLWRRTDAGGWID